MAQEDHILLGQAVFLNTTFLRTFLLVLNIYIYKNGSLLKMSPVDRHPRILRPSSTVFTLANTLAEIIFFS
jgi:hypothetical protein